MNLDEAQRQRVTAWVLQGAKLSDIQNRLADEFGIKLTYMEVRFLVDDLKLTLKDPEPPKPVAPPTPPPAAPNAKPEPAQASGRGAPAAKASGDEASPPPGKVSVTVDQLARPGAIVSGKVAFSDGQAADWYLDQTGRLGVVHQATRLQTVRRRCAAIPGRAARRTGPDGIWMSSSGRPTPADFKHLEAVSMQ